MSYGITALGILAASLTSLSYWPQATKVVRRRSTDDLSLKMLLALFIGLALWIAYGAMIGDFVVAIANAVGATVVGFVLVCKIRDLRKC